MKLQPASRKELTRITLGTLVCDVILIAALFVLSLVGVGTFDVFRILLGAVCGTVVAVANFAILCLTVQSATEIDNKKRMKARFQRSYNLRLLIQAVWVVACYLIKPIHFVAGAAPILFPNVVILFLQSRGKLVPDGEKPAAGEAERNAQEQDEPEVHPGPFEV